MHIAALIIGILAILSSAAPFAGIVLGVVAIILGVLGRRKLLEEGRSAGAAIGGIITGVLGLIAGLGFTVSCLLCGACFSAAAEQAEAQNQAMAEQMASSLGGAMANDMASGLGVPTTPGTVPGVGAVPGTVSAGGVLPLGSPTAGTVGPGMMSSPEGRPYIDYLLTITTAGTYQIDLVSPDSSAYDPYLYLLLYGAEVASDDDGGGYPNARISQMLQPGTYTVRVSSFRTSIPAPAAFTLTATQVG